MISSDAEINRKKLREYLKLISSGTTFAKRRGKSPGKKSILHMAVTP